MEACFLPHLSHTETVVLFGILLAALLFFMFLSYRLWKKQGLAERRALAEMHSVRKKTFELGENYTRQLNGLFYKSILDGVEGPLSEILKEAVYLNKKNIAEGKEIFYQAGQISQFLLNIHRLNRVTMGLTEIKKEPVICHDFVEHHISRLQKIAAMRQIRLRVQYPNADCHRRLVLDRAFFSHIFVHLSTMMLKGTPDGGRFDVSVMIPQMHSDRSALWVTLSAPDLPLSDQLFSTLTMIFNEEHHEDKSMLDTFVRIRRKLPLHERTVIAELLVLGRLLHYMGGRWSFHRDSQLGIIVDLEFFVDLV